MESSASTRKILWTVTDPRGLAISLAEDVWLNHLAYRPELATHFVQVRLAAQNPDAIYFDPDSTAEKHPVRKFTGTTRAICSPVNFSATGSPSSSKLLLRRRMIERAMWRQHCYRDVF